MIHRLELHNFKCFENAEIKCSPLTVLCGVNSCGKSSVIQAVLLLEETRCSTGMIDLMNMQHGTVLYSFDEILYDDAEDDKIRIGITMMGKSVNLILSSDENDNNVRCKIPTEELSNLQKLGTIWYLGSDRMISQYQKRGNTAKFELGKKMNIWVLYWKKGDLGKLRSIRDAI